ncbi:CGNR zinc finger domain-containing protein [Streptomyces sp. TS71-3]|uniref:CGNR zinc finger domain-containing protein n=1 Tax=Streptomyces sp. TS71-3 TaxID=2733862 RepID=UPI001B2B26EA|nr:CGNR zinc finger domain-containing protein [Streptomyces sp. TS71-3]GHJ39431.1 hypothetical protein Sm713_50400 [Streptomyces sp. TS71-3]
MAALRGNPVEGASRAGLMFTSALLATTTAEEAGVPGRDRLASPASANAWVEQLAEGVPGDYLRDLVLTPAGLVQLRRFREFLRAALRADRILSESTADTPSAPFVSAAKLSWTPAGARLLPGGTGWHRAVAVATAELLLAEAAGHLRRLKTCAYGPCGFPFIDSSRNLSRAWHDTARCGNLVNLRASRARRAQLEG